MKAKTKTAQALRKLLSDCRRMAASPWTSATTSAFVATTLGIILTFGTSAYFDEKEKQDKARTITRRVLRYIYTSTKQLSAETDKMVKADSAYQYFMHLYPDSLAQAETAMAEQLNQYIGSTSININNNTVEKIFSSSYTTWESISDDEFIDFVGSAFNIINKMKTDMDKMEEKRLELLFNIMTSEDMDNVNSVKEFAIYVISKPEMRSFAMEHSLNTIIMKNTVAMLKNIQDQYMKKMGITTEDLFENTDSIEYHIDDSKTIN